MGRFSKKLDSIIPTRWIFFQNVFLLLLFGFNYLFLKEWKIKNVHVFWDLQLSVLNQTKGDLVKIVNIFLFGFTFRMRKLFFSITAVSLLFHFILILKLTIYPELRVSKSSNNEFKSILIWKSFSKYPIYRRELECPHKCFMTEHRLVFRGGELLAAAIFCHKEQAQASKAPYYGIFCSSHLLYGIGARWVFGCPWWFFMK